MGVFENLPEWNGHLQSGKADPELHMRATGLGITPDLGLMAQEVARLYNEISPTYMNAGDAFADAVAEVLGDSGYDDEPDQVQYEDMWNQLCQAVGLIYPDLTPEDGW